MSEYITVRDALIRDIESAEAGLRGAQQSYAEAERKLHAAERAASSAYQARVNNQRNVDRLKSALAIIEGDKA